MEAIRETCIKNDWCSKVDEAVWRRPGRAHGRPGRPKWRPHSLGPQKAVYKHVLVLKHVFDMRALDAVHLLFVQQTFILRPKEPHHWAVIFSVCTRSEKNSFWCYVMSHRLFVMSLELEDSGNYRQMLDLGTFFAIFSRVWKLQFPI